MASVVLAADAFGYFASLVALLNIVGLIISSGDEHAFVRFGSPGRGGRGSLRIRRVSIGIVGSCLACVWFAFNGGWPLVVAMVTATPSVLLYGEARCVAAEWRRQGQYLPTYIVNAFALWLPRALALAPAILLFERGLNALVLIFASCSTLSLALLLLRAPLEAEPEQRSGLREWLAFSKSWRRHSIAQAGLSWIDIPLVTAIMGPAEGGLYALVSRLGASPRFVAVGLGTWFSSRHSVRLNRSDHRGVQGSTAKDYQIARRTGVGLTVVLAIGIVTTAHPVIGAAHGDLTSGSYVVLLSYLLASTFDAAFGPNAWLLGYAYSHKDVARVESIHLVGYLVLMTLGVTTFGLAGAGLAWVITVVSGNCVRQVLIMKHREPAS